MLRTSSETRSSKNLLLLKDLTKIDEIGVGGGGNGEDEIIERSLSKNLNRAISYLTPDARQAFTQLR